MLLYACCGCQTWPNPIPNTVPGSTTIISNVIKSTDWLASLFLIGFACSIVGMGLGMVKLGGVCAAGCIAGLFLKSALSVTWFYPAAALITLASITIVVAGLLYHKQYLQELVIGTQKLKDKVGAEASNILGSVQSQSTMNVVNQVKADLKSKGIL
jgi:hypothetical protein